MNITHCSVAAVLVMAFAWQAHVNPAETQRSAANIPTALVGSAAFSLPLPGAQATVPLQTIRIEPLDMTHVRLRLEGRENWVVDSEGFNLVPGVDALRLVAVPGNNTIQTTGRPSVAETFELSIAGPGVLGFHIMNEKRKPPR